MAGLQSCLKSIFVSNYIKNGLLSQSIRGRHFLALEISAVKNVRSVLTPKLNIGSDVNNIYRLASTNAFLDKDIHLETDFSKQNVTINNDNTNKENISETPPNSNLNSDIEYSSLPPIPAVEEPSPVLTFIDLGLKEPTFESLGLASWWPSGLVQKLFEFLHINLDMTWYGAIILVTIIIRTAMFPITIKSQINSAKMQNSLPMYAKLSAKMTEARRSGDYFEAALATQEFQQFMKEKGFGGFKTLAPPLIQAPVFLSMIIALRGMASAPVESMKTGGLFWFEDLTVCDPYYILPLYTALSLYFVIEINARDNAHLQTSWTLKALKLLPFGMVPFTMNMCSALLFYWSVTNTITVGQVLLLRIPFMRKLFKIPPKIQHPEPVIQKKGTVESIKESMQNFKITREIAEREYLNTTTFEKAGTSPIQRTFKKDPTKQFSKQH